jgi:hypothetical protein
MDAQDMILDEITRKQLIWYGHVERMDPTCLPKVMIHWEPKGRKKRGHPWRTWKDGMYTAMKERDEWANGTEGNGVWQPEGIVRCCKPAQYNINTNITFCIAFGIIRGFI